MSWLCLGHLAQAQMDPVHPGFPYMVSFGPEEHPSLGQVWSICEDTRGLVYAGVNNGVLFFDGNLWRSIKIGAYASALSLAYVASEDRIYVGGDDELGYLKVDSLGRQRFVSLRPFLPELEQAIGKVWGVMELPEGIMFRSRNWLLHWTGAEFETWQLPNGFDRSFWVDGQLFVQERGGGLFVLKNKALDKVPHSDWLVGKRLRSWLVRPGGDVFVTRSDGVYRWARNKTKPEPLIIPKGSPDTELYHAWQDKDFRTYFATVGEGLMLVDSSMKVLGRWNRKLGLAHDVVYTIYPKVGTGVWVGTRRGLSLVGSDLPYRYIKADQGIPTGLECLTMLEDQMLFGGSEGLFSLNKKGQFNRWENAPSGIKALQSRGDRLLVAGANGLSLWNGAKWRTLSRQAYKSLSWKKDQIWTGGHELLELWNLGENEAIKNKIIPLPFFGLINQIHPVSEQSVWIESADQIAQIQLSTHSSASVNEDTIEIYGVDQFNQGGQIRLYPLNGEMYAMPKLVPDNQPFHLYRYDNEQDSFVMDSLDLPVSERAAAMGIPLFSDLQGHVWVDFPQEELGRFQSVFVDPDGTSDQRDFTSLNASLGYFYGAIQADEKRKLWWTLGLNGITVFSLEKLKQNSTLPLPFLEVVQVVDKDLVLISGGFEQIDREEPILDYGKYRMRFLMGLPFFTHLEKNLYQFKLEGYDPDWQDWTDDGVIEYTGLQEGAYSFLVRGMDEDGHISPISQYSFRVMPPWYRSIWAWTLYGASLIGLGIMIWQWARRREQQKAYLKIALAAAEKDREIQTLQSRFFTNISHEFRTPLSLILGRIESWTNKAESSPASPGELSSIQRNAQRLLELVNQLLDLARIDASQLKLHPRSVELNAFFKGICAGFDSLAAERGIGYEIETPAREIWAQVDPEKLHTVLINLLGNAFKFTPEGGDIQATLSTETDGTSLIFRISDSGPGIPEEDRPRIFERYYQASPDSAHGTGIGLSLTRELVELMQGDIKVEGMHGAIFTVVIPFHPVLNPLPSDESLKLPESHLSASVETEKVSLLLVEDSSDLRGFLREQLAEQYQVWEAANGEEGVRMAREKIPDIILSDLMMPQLDGLGLIKQIKADPGTSHIPVILLTARAELDDRISGYETGADAYLVKPFQVREVEARIQNLLRERKRLQRLFASSLTLTPAQLSIESADERFLKLALEHVEENMANEAYGPPQLTEALGLSRTQVYRKLKALTGQSPSEFIRSLRLKRAAQLLDQQADSVSQIAYMVGFSNLSYFAKCFREQFGQSPSTYGQKKS